MAFGTEFWSAISGAMVGGVIAFAIQMVALKAATKERQDKRKEERIALGHSTMFKAIRIFSNLSHVHNHIEQAYDDVPSSQHSEPWSFVRPFANIVDDVHLSSEEMSFILSLQEPELLNRFMSLDIIHNSLNDGFKTYRDIRTEMMNSMPAEKMDGMIATGNFSTDEQKMLRPKMAALNSLVEDLRAQAKIDYQESEQAMNELKDSLNQKLGLQLTLEPKGTSNQA